MPHDMFDVSLAGFSKQELATFDPARAEREVLRELIARHGAPQLGAREKRALGRIFSIIRWGELAALKISAQLADHLVPLASKLAASSQVHDEARHFYVMQLTIETTRSRSSSSSASCASRRGTSAWARSSCPHSSRRSRSRRWSPICSPSASTRATPPVNRLFHGLCELLFPSEGAGSSVSKATRLAHAVGVARRTREGMLEIADRARAAE